MGTRHIIMVQVGSEMKVAVCVKMDGYPEGTGNDLLALIHNPENLNKFVKGLKKTKYFKKYNPDIYFSGAYDFISRLCNSEETEKKIELNNDISFTGDSLFCEWGYKLVFDSKYNFLGMDVYKGFNTGDHISEFWMYEDAKPEKTHSGNRYFGIYKLWNFRYKREGVISFPKSFNYNQETEEYEPVY